MTISFLPSINFEDWNKKGKQTVLKNSKDVNVMFLFIRMCTWNIMKTNGSI